MARQFKKIAKVSILALIVGISACSENKSAEQHIAAANVYVQNNDINAAVIELKNALRMEPRNITARYQLGRVYSEQGDYLGAEKELEKSKELGFSDGKILVDIAFVKMKLEKVDEIDNLLDEASQLSDDDYAALLTYGGIAAVNDNNLDKANDYFSQVSGVDSNAPYRTYAKAYQYYANKKFTDGLAVLEPLLAEWEEFSEVTLLQGHLLFAIEEYEGASTNYAQYRQAHPLAHTVMLLETQSLLRNNSYEKAAVNVSFLLKVFDKAPIVNQFKAQIEYQNENFEDAKLYADKALQSNSQLVVSKIVAGISAYKLDNYEQAYGYLQPLEKYLPLSHPVNNVLAKLKLKLGYVSDAATMYDNLESLTQSDVNFLQATSGIFLQAGDFNTARKLIEKASSLSPENTNVAAQKGLLLLSDDQNAGMAALEKAIQLDPELTDVELVLAIQYLDSGDAVKAKAIADKWLASEDKKAMGYFLTGSISAHQNKNQEAKSHFLRVLELDPEYAAALYRLAEIAEIAGDYQEAVNYYQQLLVLVPTHESAILKLSRLRYEHKESLATVKFLQTLDEREKNNVVVALALAQNLRLSNQLDEAISTLEPFRNDINLPAAYWIILGDSYAQAQNMEQAEECFENAHKLNPYNFTTHMRMLAMLEYHRKYQEALEFAQASLIQFPNNDYLLLLKANFELLTNNVPAAKNTIDLMLEKGTKHELLNKYIAKIALAEKDYEAAIENFNILYEREPSGLNAMLLARSLKFSGQQDEAALVLESYLDSVRKDHKVRMLLAELYMKFDVEKAKKHLVIINNDVDDNLVVLNNLAMLELKNGAFDKSLMYAEQAYKLNSNMYQVLDTYGVALVSSRQFDAAIPILEKALAQGSKSETTYVNLAKAYVSEGKKEKITTLIESIESKEVAEKIRVIGQ